MSTLITGESLTRFQATVRMGVGGCGSICYSVLLSRSISLPSPILQMLQRGPSCKYLGKLRQLLELAEVVRLPQCSQRPLISVPALGYHVLGNDKWKLTDGISKGHGLLPFWL